MTPDEEADRLAGIAIELVCRVREDPPDAVQRWLNSITTPADRDQLNYVLAIAVPLDRTWRQLTAWTLNPPPTTTRVPLTDLTERLPCGTVAAAARHRRLKETIDEACREAERIGVRTRSGRRAREVAA